MRCVSIIHCSIVSPNPLWSVNEKCDFRRIRRSASGSGALRSLFFTSNNSDIQDSLEYSQAGLKSHLWLQTYPNREFKSTIMSIKGLDWAAQYRNGRGPLHDYHAVLKPMETM
jgi:hypothetical protein